MVKILNWILSSQSSNQSIKGDFNGDSKANIVGFSSAGAIYYSTNLRVWTAILGSLAKFGKFN